MYFLNIINNQILTVLVVLLGARVMPDVNPDGLLEEAKEFQLTPLVDLQPYREAVTAEDPMAEPR